MSVLSLRRFLVLVTVLTVQPIAAVEFEKILLPIAVPYEVHGAFGSIWVKRFIVHNDSLQPVTITPSPNGCLLAVCSLQIPAGTTVEPHFSPPGAERGSFVYLEKPGSSSVALNLRIQDISRGALTWGTEIPIVRERDVRMDSFSLLDVPTDAPFRAALRVYDFDGSASNRVRVQISDLESNEELAETSLLLGLPSGFQDPYSPGFAQISSLTAAFPQTVGHRIRVTIRPDTLGLRFWAFVSVTNNETQQVTTITPQ